MGPDITENVKLHLETFLHMHSGKQCVLFDFDECLIDGHLSKQITLEFAQHIDKELDFTDTSLEGITRLLDMYIGVSRNAIWRICKTASSKVRFRSYVVDLLKALNQKNIPVVIISSGLGMAMDTKFSENTCLAYNKFACEFRFDANDICVSPSEVINDRTKGEIALQIAQSGRFEKVYSIGHSRGDIPMLKSSIGICLKGEPQAEAASLYVVNDFLDVSRIILPD